MLVTTLACLIAAMTFLVAMLYAAVSDMRNRRIPNWLVLGLAAAYVPLAYFAGYTPVGIVINIAVAAVVFAGGAYAFTKGWLGGGDVKLGAVCTMWLGASLSAPFILVAALFGCVFTLAALVGLRFMASSGANGASLREDGIPYGPGMACAALLLFQWSPWANALS